MDVFLEYTLGETLRALDGVPQPAAVPLAGHDAHDHEPGQSPCPRVFLDKGDRVVRYQLDRLSDAQLLMVERSTDDPRYRPVFEAMLLRPGLSRQHREEALQGLVRIDGSDPVPVLLDALTRLGEADRTRRTVARQLAGLLLDRPADELATHSEALPGRGPLRRRAGPARRLRRARDRPASPSPPGRWPPGMTPPGSPSSTASRSSGPTRRGPASAASWSSPSATTYPADVRRAAIRALATIPADRRENVRVLAGFVWSSRSGRRPSRPSCRSPRRIGRPTSPGRSSPG